MPRLAVTADVHYDPTGYFTTPEEVAALVTRIEAQRPDAVVLAGDLGHPLQNFVDCLGAFRRLSVPVGVLAGNHDVWRDEQGFSSRELWEERLPAATAQAGFVWLEAEVLRLGDVAVLGSLAWYDYSAAPAELGLPAEYFATRKRSLSMDATWIDWPWSDVEFAAELRAGLIRRLELVEQDPGVQAAVVITHVPLFEEQIIRKPGDRRWETSNAFFGNLTTGQVVLASRKVVQVVSGHTHNARHAVLRRPDGPDLAVSVVGSDYGKPAFELLELKPG